MMTVKKSDIHLKKMVAISLKYYLLNKKENEIQFYIVGFFLNLSLVRVEIR